ncbi:hypothetical protein FDO65_16395 [Nakamurella flava]|uniref:Uncharacterized protein n=1 Tax=Nakamurella flava TaxID=2576308 RepID=A0A4U6QCS5_9ACTN|nr:hypothetical protein [Nakamurella flava]TKV57726.1 hypothetical protein FDO65_16395 [Nakamurella flava]
MGSTCAAVLGLAMVGCGSEVPPDAPTALLVTRQCEEPPADAPIVSLIGAVPVSLVLCEIPAVDAAGPEGSIIPTSQMYPSAFFAASQAGVVLAALSAVPADPPGTCPTVTRYVAPVYLRLADGRLLRFMPPTNRCGYPSDEFVDFLRSLGFAYAGSGALRP